MTVVNITLDNGVIGNTPTGDVLLRFRLAQITLGDNNIHLTERETVRCRYNIQASVDLIPAVWLVDGLAGYPITFEVPATGPADLKDLIEASIGIPATAPARTISDAVNAYLAAHPVTVTDESVAALLADDTDTKAAVADVARQIGDANYAPVFPTSQSIVIDPATGNVTSVTTDGVTTNYTYNPDGSVHTDACNGVIRDYGYDGSGNLTSITARS